MVLNTKYTFSSGAKIAVYTFHGCTIEVLHGFHTENLLKGCIFARDEDPDPFIFGPPDPVLFSLDPDPTCSNGFMILF